MSDMWTKFYEWMVEEITNSLSYIKGQNTKISNELEKIMAKIDDVNTKADAQAAKANKAYAEITKLIADLKAASITPEALKAAVDAAKALQKGEDDTAVNAMLDALLVKLGSTDTALTKLDDVVADVPPSPPIPTP